VLIDGHRINEATYGSSAIGRDFPVNIDLINHIEIVRGPSSSLYGTNAFFGVINIFTKRGRDYKGPEVTALVGDHDTLGGSLTYGQRFNNGLELLLSGSSSKSDGDDWYYEEFDDPYTNNGWAEGIDDYETYRLFLKAAIADFTLVGSFGHREDGYPTAPWWTEFNDPNSNMTDEFYFFDLKYEHVTESGLEITSRIFYNGYDYDGAYPYDWADYDFDPDLDPYILYGIDGAHSDLWGVELQAVKNLWDSHRLIFGGEYRDSFALEQNYYNYQATAVGSDYEYIDPHPLNSEEDAYSWAFYLQDEYRINEQWILNAGLRVDHYSSFGNTSNPRVAMIYNPRNKTAIKFLYGSAFRAPSAYEVYYGDNLTQFGNPDLEPETITTYEIAWEEQITNNLRTVVNLFYYQIDDLIGQTYNADDALIFENIEEIEAQGIEFELEGKFFDKVDARFSYTYQKTENTQTGDRLSNSPEHLGKININVPVWRDKLFLNFEELYSSSKLTVATEDRPVERLDAAWVSNLTLYAQKIIGTLDLSLSVYNLFDEEYEVPGSAEHLQAGLEQAGRNILFKATYSF